MLVKELERDDPKEKMTLPGIPLALKMSAEHDEALALRLERRDPDAILDLYDRFGRLVWSVILAIVHDEEVAEDVVQETFLRVWNRMHAFDVRRAALGPWLLSIARNSAIERTGSRADRNAIERDAREHPSLFVGMERDALDLDHSRVVRSALAQLGEQQRKAVELAYYEGLPQSEMAARIGEPVGTIATRLRTALHHLRQALGQEVRA